MANLIDLKLGEHPPAGERHALVVSSSILLPHGVAFTDHVLGRRYFAGQSERDIALVVTRARIWADEKRVSNVYVRRD